MCADAGSGDSCHLKAIDLLPELIGMQPTDQSKSSLIRASPPLPRGCAVANRAAHGTENVTRVFDDAHGEVSKPMVEQLRRTSVRLTPWA